MGSRTGRIAATVILVGSALTAGACTSTDCSAVLFLDAVVVHFAPAANTDKLTTIRACAGDTCAESALDPTNADQSIPIPMGAGEVTVTVTGRTTTGQQLFAGSTTVTPIISQPDGPDCQSAYLAKVTVTRSGVSPTS